MRKIFLLFLLIFFTNHIYSQSNGYTLYMYDSWGDGWNGNSFRLYDSNGNLDHTISLNWGSSGSQYLYINPDSYTIICDGGSYPGEVSWQLRNSYGQTTLSGGAPYSNSGYIAYGYFYSQPVINSISPNTGVPSQTLSVNISGSGFSQFSGTVPDFRFNQWSGTNIINGNSSSLSGNNLYGDITLPCDAAGYYDVEILDNSSGNWINSPNPFFVDSSISQVTCLEQTSSAQGDFLSVEISGNFNYNTPYSTNPIIKFSQWSGTNSFYPLTDSINECKLYGHINVPYTQEVGSYDLEVFDNYSSPVFSDFVYDALYIHPYLLSSSVDSISPDYAFTNNSLTVHISGTNIDYGNLCQKDPNFKISMFNQFSGTNHEIFSTNTSFNGKDLYGDLDISNNTPIGMYDVSVFNYRDSSWLVLPSSFEVISNNIIYGCTDSTALNYDLYANWDDGSCSYCDLTNIITIQHPTDSISCDGFGLVNSTSSYSINSYQWENSSGLTVSSSNYVFGLCNGMYYLTVADNIGCIAFDTLAIGQIYGCTDSSYYEYNPFANNDDGSCITQIIYGCTDSLSYNYNSNANYDDGNCCYLSGCLDSTALNFNPYACFADNSNCILAIYGCTDPVASNFNSFANINDGSCEPFLYGCTDSLAFNFDAIANTNDGSCLYCDLTNSLFTIPNTTGNCDGLILSTPNSSYSPISYSWNVGNNSNNLTNLCPGLYILTISDSVGCQIVDSIIMNVTLGCTDSIAENFDPTATYNDGSCIYCFQSDSIIFNYTGAMQTFIVPAGVTNITIKAYGAEGGGRSISGNSSSGLGGLGGYSIGDLAVSPGSLLSIFVGGHGLSTTSGYAAGGWNGGGSGHASSYGEPGNGGGGASDVRLNGNYLTDRVIVAAGGGGGGEDTYDSYGDGGGFQGTNGYYAGTQFYAGGGGGLGYGGSTGLGDGGGGGGGYHGGGTPYSSNLGADTQGGGGGSSFIGGLTNAATLAAQRSGNGLVILYYNSLLTPGCTDPNADNYDSLAICDDGSCYTCDLNYTYVSYQNTIGNCDGSIYFVADSSNYGLVTYVWQLNGSIFDSTVSSFNVQTQFGLCEGTYTVTATDTNGCSFSETIIIGGIPGCTDSTALNYDPNATVDDGSCTYPSNCTSPKPTGLYSYDVIDTRAKIGWDNMNDPNCMVWKYFVRYREVGTSGWTTKSAGVGNGLCNFGLNTVTKQLLNLTPSTTYEFRMKAFYCGGTSSNYSTPFQFTTANPCPDMINLTTTTFNGNQSKVRFNWDTTGAYTFARILLRVDTVGANWQTAGGFGVYYPTFFVNKFGLQSGESYRAQGRTFCDSNITAYRSPTWTAPIFWTQPGTIRFGGGSSINNLDVYPNPSRDVFNISFNSDKRQDLSIRILNLVGAEVYREDRQEFVGEYIKQISLDNYGKGIYFLEIQTPKGIVNKKLILQ